jgi:hypothetical protein
MQVTETNVRRYGTALTTLLALVSGVAGATAADRAGNYLVVTPTGYDGSAPLTQFIDARTGMGFNVMTYVVPSGTTKETIRSYIRSLWGTADAPDYILIVGDTAGSSTSTSTTIPHWIGLASRHACSDVYYACMDDGDDWQPEIAIGRFSVTSVGQLQTVVDKTLHVEAGVYDDPNYVERAALLAASDMTSGAEETHNWVIENFLEPEEFECTRVFARLGGDTADIAAAVNRGCLFTVYGGHSTSSGWYNPAFYQEDVRALTNDGLYGMAFGWSCNSAHFSYSECFGETWLRVPNKGAAAYLSASDLIFWGDWDDWEPTRQLERYFFTAIFADGIREVGPAWRTALYYFLDDYGSDPSYPDYLNRTRNLFEEMVLLGDPALYLPEGRGFELDPEPASQFVCSPPADEVAYTISVNPTGDFDEVVTLTASGVPSGASVAFSVNSRPPPFTTVMTVSDIIAGSPGLYAIEIRGTAASLVRSATVELGLSTDVPGTVTPTSPADGATDISRTPTLSWLPADQGMEYELEVSSSPDFATIIYRAVVPETEHALETSLESATEYFWRVRAINGCGDSDFSEVFSFTTIAQTYYFTEQFESGFDLDYLTVEFAPDGSGDFYDMCAYEADALPVDPAGGTSLYIEEDRYAQVVLADSRTVRLYGLGYSNFYVCDNGYLTFTEGDSDYSESLGEHFDLPRISVLYDDLSIRYGTVSWKQLDDRAVVTCEDVPEYGTGNQNTYQVELFFDGEIRITWLRIDVDDCIVGLSAGEGLPDDFIATDISAAGPCGPDCPGDLDGDGTIGLGDLAILLAHYPTDSGATYDDGDLDDDGDVDLADLATLLAIYGTDCD